MSQPQPTLFRVALVEGVAPSQVELGCAFIAGTYEPDPTQPGAMVAHLPDLPEAMTAQLDPVLHPLRTLRCDRMPVTPDECVADGFTRALGGPEPKTCWACGEEATWHLLLKLMRGDVHVAYAVIWHCGEHRPGDAPLTVNGQPYGVVRRPDSEAWKLIQQTTSPQGGR